MSRSRRGKSEKEGAGRGEGQGHDGHVGQLDGKVVWDVGVGEGKFEA